VLEEVGEGQGGGLQRRDVGKRSRPSEGTDSQQTGQHQDPGDDSCNSE
jgi:hypothetical protein